MWIGCCHLVRSDVGWATFGSATLQGGTHRRTLLSEPDNNHEAEAQSAYGLKKDLCQAGGIAEELADYLARQRGTHAWPRPYSSTTYAGPRIELDNTSVHTDKAVSAVSVGVAGAYSSLERTQSDRSRDPGRVGAPRRPAPPRPDVDAAKFHA